MNWNKFIRYSSVALALVAVPMATARGRGEGRSMSGRSFATAQSKPMGSSSGRVFGSSNSGRGNWNNGSGRGSGNFRIGDRGRGWHHGHHRHHRHWRHRGFYPYYGYYPFGFGLGYPYYGSSASLYYNGYHPQYVSNARGGGSVVIDVQQELARAGYYRGAIDGVMGDGTRRAIRAYERANGLSVDGRIDSDLLSAMGLS